jgi:hypothetical protein
MPTPAPLCILAASKLAEAVRLYQTRSRLDDRSRQWYTPLQWSDCKTKRLGGRTETARKVVSSVDIAAALSAIASRFLRSFPATKSLHAMVVLCGMICIILPNPSEVYKDCTLANRRNPVPDWSDRKHPNTGAVSICLNR